MRASLNDAEAKAAEVGAHMVMIGILPTLSDGHMSPASLTANPRYQLLSDQILAARGEDIVIDIRGPERLRTTADSIVPEAACTSTQLHIQVSPEDFPAYWNASQAIAGVQLALGANSPFLLGRELWRETRIPLFEQATDTRSEELKAQGVRPRVWFGERWINSIFDLFEENVRYFPALLPVIDDEDPLDGARVRRAPRRWPSCGCTTAPSTAGTGRSTTSSTACRTCGSRTACCRPARRSPTRWPTPRSTSGWCGRWPSTSGRCGRRCRSAPPRRTSTSRPEQGIDAKVYWPGLGQVPRHRARRAPAAADGARRARRRGACTAEESDRLLGIIEQRCIVGQNGASWFAGRFATRRRARTTATGSTRCAARCNEYREHMHTNEPVHTWDVAERSAARSRFQTRRLVGQRTSRHPARVST